MMKKLTNNYFIKFCEVIQHSLTDPSKFNDCLSDIISASEDNNNHKLVYKGEKFNMEVIRLDEYTKDFAKKRLIELPNLKNNMHQPKAVDAVCVNRNNEWFLIEFKNEPLKNVLNTTPKKMHSSLWLIAYLYSKLSEKISDEELDILKFAREKITFITVVSSEKNEDNLEAIGLTWEENGSFYTPDKFLKYKGYYFKDIYILTEIGLKFFIEKFADK